LFRDPLLEPSHVKCTHSGFGSREKPERGDEKNTEAGPAKKRRLGPSREDVLAHIFPHEGDASQSSERGCWHLLKGGAGGKGAFL